MRAALVQQSDLMKRLTAAFARAGVPLVVKSDCNISGTFAGFSFPDEFANSRHIAGSVLRGKWHPRPALRQRVANAMSDFSKLDRRLHLQLQRPVPMP